MKKTIIGITIGLAISTVVGVYATNTFNSKDISYSNENTEVTNVKDAVDQLYDKSLNEINALKSEKNDLIELKNNIIESYKQVELNYLSDVVSVGDYVAYDAGSWTETKENPTSHGEFGGYIEGQNKANSFNCSSRGSTTLKGWRVFSIDPNAKTVTLIHAGHPECYYHGTDTSTSITNLNNRATNEYLNNNYADSAHMMNLNEANQNILIGTGTWYYLATANSNCGGISLYQVADVNRLYRGCGVNFSYGVRPVVVLKPNILTTGKGLDAVGQEAWTLVKS